MLSAMLNDRFTFAFSNAAGCADDSIAHGSNGKKSEHIDRLLHKRGENLSDIVERFPYWFCKNYFKYTKENVSDSLDQHYLLASIAPRFVLVGSCDMDYRAAPESQQLCCLAASEMWGKSGLKGMADTENYLETGESLLDGCVGYFKIHSKHFFSRHSWKRCMEFVEKHKQ